MTTEEELATQLNAKLAQSANKQLSYLDVGGPMPKSMGRCADLYHDVRELRLSMEKEVAAIKARENEVENYIIDNLSRGDDTGAAGLRYRAQVVTNPKPRLIAEKWGVFTSWVRKNDRFDMLHKRLTEPAVMEWMKENDRVVPGVEVFNVKTLSVTKL